MLERVLEEDERHRRGVREVVVIDVVVHELPEAGEVRALLVDAGVCAGAEAVGEDRR